MSTPLTVQFEIGGSATPNSDYSLYNADSQVVSLNQVRVSDECSGLVQIPTGQTTATVELRPNNDATREATETATFEIIVNPAHFYNVGASSIATATHADNDAWTLNVAATNGAGVETTSGTPANPLVFTLTRSGANDLA